MCTWEKQEMEDREEGGSRLVRIWKWGKRGHMDDPDQGHIIMRLSDGQEPIVEVKPSQIATIREFRNSNRSSLSKLKKLGVLKSLKELRYSDLFQSMLNIMAPKELKFVSSLPTTTTPFRICDEHEESLAKIQHEYTKAIKVKNIKRLTYLNKLLELSLKIQSSFIFEIDCFGIPHMNERPEDLGPLWRGLRTILIELVKEKMALPYKSEIRKSWVTKYLNGDKGEAQTLAKNMRLDGYNTYSNVCKPMTDLLKRWGLNWIPGENQYKR